MALDAPPCQRYLVGHPRMLGGPPDADVAPTDHHCGECVGIGQLVSFASTHEFDLEPGRFDVV
ncbi:MAG: hypothetical protein R2770_02950 [Acidimicrobiales bacterium]